MSGRPCFASLARLPDRSTRVGQPRRRRATALSALRPIPFPRDCALRAQVWRSPPTRKREIGPKCYRGAARPEWVTSAGSLEPLVTGARNGLAMSAQGQECGSRARSSNFRNGSISAARMPMVGWLLQALMRSVSRSNKCLLVGWIARKRRHSRL